MITMRSIMSIRALQLSRSSQKEASIAARFHLGSSYNAAGKKSCIIGRGVQVSGKGSGNTNTSLHRSLSSDEKTTTNGSEAATLVTKEILQGLKDMQTEMKRREKKMQTEIESREKEMQTVLKEMQTEREEMKMEMERRKKDMQKSIDRIKEEATKEIEMIRSEMEEESSTLLTSNPSKIGRHEIRRMKELDSIVIFEESDQNDASVLTEGEQCKLMKCQSKHQIVAYVTQHLERVFADMDLLLVNCEKYDWLKPIDGPTYGEIPDLFLGHRAIVETRSPFQSDDVELATKLRQESNIFGKLQDWKLRDCIPTIFQGKKEICKNESFGKMALYGSRICSKDGPVETRMVLFDVSEFWLIECTRGIMTRATKCGWTMSGSTKLLRNFIVQKPWIDLLEGACSDFGVDVGTNAFLGSGRYGRVFRVQRKSDGAQLALKLVLDGNNGKPRYYSYGWDVPGLYQEYEITESVKNICPEFVLGVEENGFRSLSNGGGLLLSGVGEPVPEEQYGNLIASLGSLHEKDIIHGDARLYNAVVLNGTVKWMDFRPTYGSCTKKNDMKSLLGTIGVAKDNADEVVDSYKGTREDAERIAKLVC